MDASSSQAAAAAAASASATASPAPDEDVSPSHHVNIESENKPTTLNELKNILKIVLIEQLERIPNYDAESENSKINQHLQDFFTKFKIEHVKHFDIIKGNIKKLQVYNDKINPIKKKFIEEVSSYVDAATPIFNDLDDSIRAIPKLFDHVRVMSLTRRLNAEIAAVIDPIQKLKKEKPASSSSDAALTEEDIKINEYLDELIKFLNEMVAELIDSMKKNIEKEFSVDEIKKIVESDTDNYDNLVSDQVNKILETLLEYVASKQTEFDNLLNKLKSDTSVKIIDDTSSIISLFDNFNAGLKTFLKTENGALYTLLYEFYSREIQQLIQTIDRQVLQLGDVPKLDNVPVMAEAASEEDGLGGGNGDGSTLATYPVSNKSQKNRNNGKGNSKGRGKGKGKGRKPNATKKNNRH